MRWIKHQLYRLLGIVSPSGNYRQPSCPGDCEESCCGPLVTSLYNPRPEKVHASAGLKLVGPLDEEPCTPICRTCATQPHLGPIWVPSGQQTGGEGRC